MKLTTTRSESVMSYTRKPIQERSSTVQGDGDETGERSDGRVGKRNQQQVAASLRTADLRSAAIDASDLEHRIQTDGLQTGVTSGRGAVGKGQESEFGTIASGDGDGAKSFGGKDKPKAKMNLRGRWADTLQGNRWNAGGQSGSMDLGHGVSIDPGMTGGRQGQVSIFNTGDPGSSPAPKKEGGSSEGGGVPLSNGDNAGVAMGVASGTVMGPPRGNDSAFSVLVPHSGSTGPKRINLTPRDDDGGAGGGGPVFITSSDRQRIGRHVVPTDTEGGRYEGDTQGGGRANQTEMTGGQDKELKRKDSGGPISYEVALAQARFTDPGRT